jgi:hypothetical protein
MTQTYLNGQATTVPGASRAASAARAASFKRGNRPSEALLYISGKATYRDQRVNGIRFDIAQRNAQRDCWGNGIIGVGT